ncbi:MAG: chemotaxis response regulator protein-glutamate methylesterase [Sphingomonas sp.]|jgi:two-component system chemotaxis response regulator CheB|nr:chemotaxis response regulator protein-glutamate methylesterase [Sphingomonas sp.]
MDPTGRPAGQATAAGIPRVLIVDDSLVARTVLTRIAQDGGGCQVAAAVADVPSALRFLASEMVDVILLDLEMPGIDGLSGLPDLLTAGGGARVLVVSSAAGAGAAATVQALALGAADTLVKPGGSICAGNFAKVLAEKIARLTDPKEPLSGAAAAAGLAARAFDAVAIGASTGGIHALNKVLIELPPTFHAPIMVTQHLPLAFVSHFAGQLHTATGRRCVVATDRMALEDDMIVVAPGDAHLMVAPRRTGRTTLRLSRTPVANGNLPSVDPMFESGAAHFGARLLAIVLSGMGRDGLDGAREVHRAGGTVVVQDRESSVVWGMPGAVAAAGLADAVLSPSAIGGFVAGQMGAAACR